MVEHSIVSVEIRAKYVLFYHRRSQKLCVCFKLFLPPPNLGKEIQGGTWSAKVMFINKERRT